MVFPGALTPTEVMAAWKAGCDFVKIFPCAQVGGPSYIRALKVPLPQVSADCFRRCESDERHGFHSGRRRGAGHWQRADAARSGTPAAREQIQELARRFIGMVKDARAQQEELHST